MGIERIDYIKHCEAVGDVYMSDVFNITNDLFDDEIIEECYQNWKKDIENVINHGFDQVRSDLMNKRLRDWM